MLVYQRVPSIFSNFPSGFPVFDGINPPFLTVKFPARAPPGTSVPFPVPLWMMIWWGRLRSKISYISYISYIYIYLGKL
jgi:hypothetical protein